MTFQVRPQFLLAWKKAVLANIEAVVEELQDVLRQIAEEADEEEVDPTIAIRDVSSDPLTSDGATSVEIGEEESGSA
jgi:hypothetical protein